MTRVTVVVEGQTEEAFVNEVLAAALWPHGVHLTPILLGVPGHKGGRPNYARVKTQQHIVRPCWTFTVWARGFLAHQFLLASRMSPK